MKIIINENQLKYLNEDLASMENVSAALKESIAVWCLISDFRFYVPNNIFGNRVSLANSSHIQRDICSDIMNGIVTVADDQKELFGYYDSSDSIEGDDERDEFMDGNRIYKVKTIQEEYFIEVDANIQEYYGAEIMRRFSNGLIDKDKWYYDSLLWFKQKFG